MGAAGAGGANLGGLIVPNSLFSYLYIFAIRPQRKRQKEITEMRSSLRVGDEITTIGGFYGKITKIKDEVITIEVGSDRTKLDVTRWAIGNVTNRDNRKR